MSAAQRPAKRPLPMHQPAGLPAGPAILLADDSPTLAALAADYLRGEGYRVTVATGLAEAEALLARARFALAPTDPFRLGTSALGTDRWTNLRRLCELAGGAPVVICSPYGADEFAAYRERCGSPTARRTCSPSCAAPSPPSCPSPVFRTPRCSG